MEKLVSLYESKTPVVRSWDIFKGFGYKKHDYLKAVIFNHRDDFNEFGQLIITSVDVGIKNKKGRPDESFLLNEEQFTLLVTLAKNTPESVELKKRVVKEFFRMREMLSKQVAQRKSIDWQTARQDGKAIYHQKTDVLKLFVDYATAQGSKSASMYYQSIAKMENAALFMLEQKFKNVREFLNVRQLQQVAIADQIVEKALQDGMDQNMHYKDIYTLAKDRVIQFSNIIGKSLVIEFQQSLLPKQ